jgi:surfeit locus 1 family protein
MAGARKTFRPPLWGAIGLIFSGSICIGAGIWQLDRAEQKRQIFDAFGSGSGAPVRNQLVTNEAADQVIYQRFFIRGHYDGAHQVLIDNMMFEGRNGYQILTPLRTGDEVILVNRGWVPANPDRSVLPDISVDGRSRKITGRLSRLPRPGLRLDPPITSAGSAWPRRLLFPQTPELITQLGYVVYDYQLLLDPDIPDGFVRDWSPNLMSPEKHIAYAIQWFLLALTLLVIFGVVNWKVPTESTPNA